jgi:hypothetical protein
MILIRENQTRQVFDFLQIFDPISPFYIQLFSEWKIDFVFPISRVPGYLTYLI